MTRGKDNPVRIIEVGLIRAVANYALYGVAEAENLAPGEGVVFLWLVDGTKLRLTIELVP